MNRWQHLFITVGIVLFCVGGFLGQTEQALLGQGFLNLAILGKVFGK